MAQLSYLLATGAGDRQAHPAAFCYQGDGIVRNSLSSRDLKQGHDWVGAVMALALAILTVIALTPSPASAQVVERGVEGAAVGALIGGLAGGGKGVGKGAAIGAGVGVAAGAIERDQRKHHYDRAYGGPPPPPPGYGYTDLVAKTQAALNRLGYQPGPVDGQMGPGTANAIRRYQYAWGLPVTGEPSYPLLDNMRAHGG
jgi:Putative peptidoglycan binding domain